MTTTTHVSDSAVALDILATTYSFLPITECTFLADKCYEVKSIYHQLKKLYNGECVIPLNRRNAKKPKLLQLGNPFCEASPAM